MSFITDIKTFAALGSGVIGSGLIGDFFACENQGVMGCLTGRYREQARSHIRSCERHSLSLIHI